MMFYSYQQEAAKTAIYPGRGTLKGLEYAVLGLCGEAGEVANKLKKVLRDHCGLLTKDRKEELAKEIGDVIWYISAIADELGYDLHEIAAMNLDKLQGRQRDGTLQGSGDVR